MNQAQRNEFKQWFRTNYCDRVMAAKGEEYSGTGRGSTDDVNGNFKRVAQLLKGAPMDELTVAMVYFLKHLDSILTYTVTRKEGTEPLYGRLGDASNYIEILGSLIFEQENSIPSTFNDHVGDFGHTPQEPQMSVRDRIDRTVVATR